MAKPLFDLAGGRCFYCKKELARSDMHLDHFVPWSRHPNNAVENLVPAHVRCNTSKSDHLAAVSHVERWIERIDFNREALTTIASEQRWPSNELVIRAIATGIYLRLPDDTPLWCASKSFEAAMHDALAAVFQRGNGPSDGDSLHT